MMRDGPLLPGPRARAHRRLPRAPGRPLRRGRRRAQPAHRQADPDRHRAGRRRPGQRRARRPCGPPAGSATRAATGPSPRSATSTATPATGRRRGRDRASRSRVGGRQPARRARRRSRWCPALRAVRAVAVGGRRGRRRRRAAAADATVAPPAPAPALATPLLSFRRAPGVLVARPQPRRRSEAAVAEFAATLDDTSCVAVAVDGVPVGAARRRPAADPGQQPEAARRRRRARGARRRPPVHDRGPRRGAPAAGVVAGDLYLVGGGDPVLDELDLSGRERSQPGDRRRRRSTRSPTRRRRRACTQIEGAVVGDGTPLRRRVVRAELGNDVRGIEAGPYDALIVNDARVTGDPQRATEPAPGRGAGADRSCSTARGVTVGGAPAAGTAPAGAAIARLGAVGADARRSSARCWRRATTTPPRCWSRSSASPGGAAGTREAGLGRDDDDARRLGHRR